MGRIVFLDYGRSRVGVAISNDTRIIATPLQVLSLKKDFHSFLHDLRTILLPFQVTEIVLGLPLLLNGKEGEMALEVREFAKLLNPHFPDLKISFFDERLSSSQAERLMKESNLSRKQRSQHVDTVAATLLLQCYLDLNHRG